MRAAGGERQPRGPEVPEARVDRASRAPHTVGQNRINEGSTRLSNLRVDLTGRIAIVTGAGRGIGRAYAEALAASGAGIVVADIDRAGAETVAAALAATGAKAVPVVADVADEAAVERMVAETVAAFGRVDILINNAAVYAGIQRQRFDKFSVAEWRKVIDVNVTGSYLCARAVLPDMLKRRWGRIVNISSSTVPLGRPNLTHYVTSKAAILGMTRAMGRELGPEGITVNAIMPGLTESEGTATNTSDAVWEKIVGGQSIPRREVPADLVGAALFLCSDAAAFMTGQTIVVDGGSAHL